MGTGEILLAGNPAMDYHPIRGGEAMLLGLLFMLRKPALSSGLVGLEARGNRDCRSLDVNCKSCMKQRLNHNRKQRGNKHKISFLSYLCFCLGRTFTFFTPRQKHAKKKKVKVNPQKLLLQSLADADG